MVTRLQKVEHQQEVSQEDNKSHLPLLQLHVQKYITCVKMYGNKLGTRVASQATFLMMIKDVVSAAVVLSAINSCVDQCQGATVPVSFN